MSIVLKQFLMLVLFFPAFMQAQNSYTESQKIDHLIVYIKTLNGAAFIRNGNEHSALEAAAHLQMKREKAGSKLKTVEDFIINVASKSSISGEPYLIRFKNGNEFACEMVLRLELKKLIEGKVRLLTMR